MNSPASNTDILPAVAVIQQNNADVQARVTSRAAAEAAKASYMR